MNKMKAKPRKSLKSNSNKSHPSSLSKDLHTYALWIVGLYMTCFLFIAPFFKALFNGATRNNLSGFIFNQPIYTSMIFLFIFLLFFGLFLLARNNSEFLLQGNTVPIILACLVPVTYILALFFSAVSVSGTIHSIVIHCMYVASFMMAIFLSRHPNGLVYLTYSIIGAGYMIVIFGLLNWLTGPFYTDAVMLEPGRLRLTSVFQYANTYAAFLIAVLLASFYILVQIPDKPQDRNSERDKSTSRKFARSLVIQRISQIAAALMIVPACLSLLLTFSRGGLVIFPVVTFILLFLLTFRQQLIFLIYLTVAVLISLAMTPYLSDIGMVQYESFSPGPFLLGGLVIAAASVAYAGFAHFMNRKVHPKFLTHSGNNSKGRLSRVFIPFGGVLLGGIIAFMLLETSLVSLLPQAIQTRISNISLDQHSVLERATFYRDSVKIIADYPLTGTGGNGWSLLYEKYQNNPYVSTQAHSYFIQHLIETGIVGLVILLAFIAFVYWRFVRYYFNRDHEDPAGSQSLQAIFFIFATAILLHSLIDFDMSYVYVGCLVFLCLGGMIGSSSSPVETLPSRGRSWGRHLVVPVIIVICSCTLFSTAVKFQAASHHYVRAVQNAKSGQLREVLTPLDRAIDLFAHSDYIGYRASLMVDVYRQTGDRQFADEFIQTMEKIEKREPYDQLAMDKKLQYYLLSDQTDQALDTLERWLHIAPWNIQLYDKMITLLFHYGSQSQDAEEQDAWYREAMGYYHEILERIRSLEQLPKNQLPGRSFEVTPNIALAISQIHLAQGEYTSARSLLAPHIGDSSSSQYRELARYYLVASILDQSLDESLYRSFIEEYPEEVEQIDQIVKLLQVPEYITD